METALFSPWWLVSSTLGWDGYVQLRNNTEQPLDVTVTAYLFDGTTTGTPASGTLPPNGSTNVILGAPVLEGGMAVPDGFGSAQISHNGPPGAIVANLTMLNANLAFSYDTVFSPRMRWTPSGR